MLDERAGLRRAPTMARAQARRHVYGSGRNDTMDGDRLIALAIPFFFLLIGLELLVARARRRRERLPAGGRARGPGLRDRRSRCVLVFAGAALLGVYAWCTSTARLVDLRRRQRRAVGGRRSSPSTSSTTGGTAPATEVNFLWAAHVVHHQSEDYNLAVALRQAIADAASPRCPSTCRWRSSACRRIVYATVSRSTRSTSSGSTPSWSGSSGRSSGSSTRRRTTACTTR